MPPRINKILNDAGKFAPFLIESMGTFFLTLVICMSAALPPGNKMSCNIEPELDSISNSYYPAFISGTCLALLVYAGGHISGAHYNPAISIAVFLTFRNKLKAGNLIVYIFVQFLFALLAAFLAWGLQGNTVNFTPCLFVSGGKYAWYQAIFAEFFFSILLITAFLNTATTRSQEGNSFYGACIGFAGFVGGAVTGPISGGVFNPAVGSAALIVNAINRDNWDQLEPVWIYWAGPLVASLFAAAFFIITHRKEYNIDAYNREDYGTLKDEYPTLN